MLAIDRRNFLRGSAAASLSLTVPAELMAQASSAAPASNWDAGAVRHLLPTVSDSRILIKASFNAPLAAAPTLRVGGTSVRGRMGDTRGEHWHFYATDLQPGRPYQLSLTGERGAPLCEPWELATFPGAGRPPGALPPADLHLRGRPRGAQVSADRDPQPPAAARAELRAAGGRRQRRSGLLGSARAGRRQAARHASRRRQARRHLRPLGGRARRRQRSGAQARGRPADHAGLRHRLPLDADVLHAGRPRLFRQRRSHRRGRHLPAVLFHAAARARDPGHVLPRIPSRRGAAARPAVVVGGRPGVGRVGELRHAALRPPRRAACSTTCAAR